MLRGGGGDNWHPIKGGVVILLVALCYGNRDKLRLGGPLMAQVNLKLCFNYCRRILLLKFLTWHGMDLEMMGL